MSSTSPSPLNHLYYGDNLDVLNRHVASGSVDLVYLDPPFNSKRNYSVIFSRNSRVDAENTAQIEAFEDTWRWTQVTEQQFAHFAEIAPGQVADALTAFRTLLGENDAMAYLVNMAPRLLDLHRVLKDTGSIYLHCDPTMSHYLKVLLDSIFDARNFRNEIIWHYNTGGKGKRNFLRKHDTILWYSKSDRYTFNRDAVAVPRTVGTAHLRHGVDEDGREFYEDYSPRKSGKKYRWYLDEGLTPMDVWTDIQAINPMASERLGYPTQKPVALLERIITASSNPGDVVLDPFCGCGTTIDAAQKLGRSWIGIDITYIAVGLIQARLKDTYGPEIVDTYKVEGIPRDLPSARALFDQSPFDFERWAVTLADGTPNEKQVGDRGIDGVIRFPNDLKGKVRAGRVLVSVKGGRSLNPGMVRDLVGTVQSQQADMGVLITLTKPTAGMTEAANHSGTYTWAVNGQSFPRVQIITVSELLNFRRPKMPPPLAPYIQAARAKPVSGQDTFDL